MHHVFNGVLISNKVDAHQASVTVGRVEGLEAVAQVGLHCQASQAAAQMLNVGRRDMAMIVNTYKLLLRMVEIWHKKKSNDKILFLSTV